MCSPFSSVGLNQQTDFPSCSGRLWGRHTRLSTPTEINILCDHRIRLHLLYNAFYVMHHGLFRFLFIWSFRRLTSIVQRKSSLYTRCGVRFNASLVPIVSVPPWFWWINLNVGPMPRLVSNAMLGLLIWIHFSAATDHNFLCSGQGVIALLAQLIHRLFSVI